MRAGTNPNDVNSRFAVNGSNASAGVNLKWPTVVGKTYRLESAPALTGATWTTIEDSIQGTGGILLRTNRSMPARRASTASTSINNQIVSWARRAVSCVPPLHSSERNCCADVDSISKSSKAGEK